MEASVVEKNKTDEYNEHTLFEYFKEHTAFFVTCVSAMVAITSFVVRYAADRYVGFYLSYWNIHTGFSGNSSVGQINTIIIVIVNCAVYLILHALFSSSAEEYKHYNRLLSMLNWLTKEQDRKQKELRKQGKLLRKMLSKSNERSDEISMIYEKINTTSSNIENNKRILAETLDAKSAYQKWLNSNVIKPLILSLFIVLLNTIFLFPVVKVGSYYDGIALIVFQLVITVLSFAVYYVPAYCSSKITKKKFQELDVEKFVEEMLDVDKHQFPLEKFFQKGLKSILTDSIIARAMAEGILLLMIVPVMLSWLGTEAATIKKEFQVVSDSSGTYAVIYNTGTEFIMEKAIIEEDSISIDTRIQRIISINDVIYEVLEFDSVQKIDVGGTVKDE